MSKLQNVWVLTDQAGLLGELCTGAAELGERVSLVFAGDKAAAAGADVVYYLGELNSDKLFVNYIPSILQLVEQEKPDLILVGVTKNGRLAAGCLAAACGTSVLTDVSEITVDSGVRTKRMVYGGAAFSTEHVAFGTAIVCVGAGVFEPAPLKAAGNVVDVTYVAPAVKVKCIEKRTKTGEKVNLSAAKKVVAVGRGFSAQADLQMAFDLAAAIGAEVGCSRPVAEEEKWMGKERYIGVSGVMLKPELYIGIGISGQVQHMVGINQARTLVAINKDKNAPIFKQADYGIVGDLNKVLPALTKLFQR